jgi:hypothetical protein
MVLETGIFASQAIWLWRVRHIRREAKAAGQTYDEYVAANPSKRLRSESTETVVDIEACHASKTGSVCTDKQESESVGATQDGACESKREMGEKVESVVPQDSGSNEKEKSSRMESVVADDEAREKPSVDGLKQVS